MMSDSPFTVAGIIRPKPERCDGSAQRVWITGPDSECPVCGRRVQIVDVDATPVLVDHAPRRAEALPLEMFA